MSGQEMMEVDHVSAAPESKHARRNGLEELRSKVSIEMTNHLILKQFTEVLANLLSEVDFQIVCNPPHFTGLEVATLNANKSCMIQARFSSLIAATDKSITSFCVDVNTLYNCLDCADPNQSVMLGVDHDVVRFDVIQAGGMLNGASLMIPRKVSTQGTWYFNENFRYAIKFKQAFFRKYIKIMKNFKVDKVDFCLYRPPAPPGGEDSATRSLYFAFRGDSDQVNDICFWFHSTTRVADSPLTPSATESYQEPSTSTSTSTSTSASAGMREIYGQTYVTIEDDQPPPNTDSGLSPSTKKYVPNLDSMEELYRERFQIRYLELFTKNIDRNDLTLYMKEKLPLVLHFPVGDTSYIRFVLMMCEKDDEDTDVPLPSE
jgi:hypothetical protein